jgi:NAD(P)H-dependent FMN reductase
MMKLQVIVGTTRPTRAADKVLPWLTDRTSKHPAFETEILDLREWPLPFFQEHLGTIGDMNNPTYSDPIVKRWNQKVKEADAYVIVTAEYNHGIPAVLKNAIDTVFVSFGFRHKPVAFVAYSSGVSAGIRAVEHLNQVMIETEAIPVRQPTLIPFVADAFDASGNPINPATEAGMTVMLDDLAWLGKALKTARAEGQLPPGTFRLRAIMAKK